MNREQTVNSVVSTGPTPAEHSTPAATVEGRDRRRSQREARNLPAWLSDQSGGRRPQQQRVTVTDMSLHGCGFIASERPENGATHWIVIAAENLHLSTRLRVVNLRQRQDGAWDVGAEFY